MDQTGEEVPQKGQRIVLELPKVDYGKPLDQMTKIEKWATFFMFASNLDRREELNILFSETEDIAMAGASLLTISKDEHERARLLSEHKYQMDIQCRMIDAENKGLQKGEVIGETRAKHQTAQNLLNMNMPVTEISKATGLTVAEVQKLQAENKE